MRLGVHEREFVHAMLVHEQQVLAVELGGRRTR
jgi:hypothetical protein